MGPDSWPEVTVSPDDAPFHRCSKPLSSLSRVATWPACRSALGLAAWQHQPWCVLAEAASAGIVIWQHVTWVGQDEPARDAAHRHVARAPHRRHRRGCGEPPDGPGWQLDSGREYTQTGPAGSGPLVGDAARGRAGKRGGYHDGYPGCEEQEQGVVARIASMLDMLDPPHATCHMRMEAARERARDAHRAVWRPTRSCTR